MAKKEQIQIGVTAEDDASKILEKIADLAEQLEKIKAEVEVGATDNASAELEGVEAKTKALDGDKAEVTATARDQASSDLERVESKTKSLDGRKAEVEVSADTGQAESALSGLSGSLDGVGSAAGGIQGALGAVGGALGPVGAGAAGASVGMFALADGATDAAIEVDNLAQMTGESVEDTSRLARIWQSAGGNAGDLADVIAQVNGVLAEQPELAEQLGVSLEGLSPQEVFVQMVDAINGVDDAQQRLVLGSQAFGEEGVRQVAAVTGKYGDLSDAQAEMDPLFTEEDIEKAREYQAAMDQVNMKFQEMAIQIGNELLPLLEMIKPILDTLPEEVMPEDIDPKYKVVEEDLNNMGGAAKRAGSFVDGVTTSFQNAYDATQDLNGELAELKGNLDLESEYASAVAGADSLAGSIETRIALEQQGKQGTEEWNDATADQAQQNRDLRTDIVDLVSEYGTIPPEIVSQIMAELPEAEQAEFRGFIDEVELKHVAEITAQLPEADQATFLNFLATSDVGAQAEILATLPQTKQMEFLTFLGEVDAGALAEILATLPVATQQRFEAFLGTVAAGETAPINADANTGAAETELNHVSRDRTANVTAFVRPQLTGSRLDALLSLDGRAGGGHVNAGQSYVVGERRAEVFTPSVSGHIDPSIGGISTAGGGGGTFNYTINLPKGTRGDDLLRTMRQHARRNGAKVRF